MASRSNEGRSTLRSNRSTFWGLVVAVVVVIALAAMTATGTIGLALLIPVLALVAFSLAGSLWVISLRARRKLGASDDEHRHN